MLLARGLSCERSRRQLFSALDVELGPGQLLQVRGRNGSGKTTLLRILMGFFTDFEGEIEWDLESPPLFLGHSPGVNPRMTVVENIRWLCLMQDTEVTDGEIDRVLVVLGLEGYQDSFCSGLSEGQRKRVNLARFFLCDNPCWIMDEPFSSIDAAGFDHLQERMQSHLQAGGGILLTSHQTLTLESEIRMLDLTP